MSWSATSSGRRVLNKTDPPSVTNLDISKAMSESNSPLSYRYQKALEPLAQKADASERGPLGKRLSELLTLLDFNTTLNQSLALQEILDIVLFVAMGETRASWAGVLLRKSDGTFKPAARRGSSDAEWADRSFSSEGVEPMKGTVGHGDPHLAEPIRGLMETTEAQLAVPLQKGGNFIGLLLLGRPAFAVGDSSSSDASYTEGERAFADALAISASACIDNGRIYEELRDLNRSLSLKVYQLNSLFDVTRELHRAMDAAAVREVIIASAMGQILATRCLLFEPDGTLKARGVKLTPDELQLVRSQMRYLQSLIEDLRTDQLETGALRDLLEAKEMEILVPLRSGATSHGILIMGRKANRKPLSEEDVDFLRSLATQGGATLDNLRLTREWVEKQKMEKELAVAREIQRALLPDQEPALKGWDIAGINIPCLTVGGDYYDYLKGQQDQLGLCVADVSGKGTGPALIMANVQASLRALSGLSDLPLDIMLTRLNEQIFGRTEANKYVTMFYGWLDPEKAELTYVNAGHCYPLMFRREGQVEQLDIGGPVIGLLPDVPLEVGRISFELGDMLVAYTDGLSETASPEGEEYEEARIIDATKEVSDRSAQEVAAKLVSSARIFAAEAGLADDLTLMVVRRVDG